MLLIIDNYDSFTYNIVQLVGKYKRDIQIFRNDAISLTEIARLAPKQIIISPGPSNPCDSGISLAIIEKFSGQIDILGICLGHQAIAQVFGAKIIPSQNPTHGKIANLQHDGKGIYQKIPQNFQVARYHSLIVERTSLPGCLEVTASYGDLIMGLRHKTLPNLEGIQFHPESFLTQYGDQLICNFLKIAESTGK